MRQCVLIETELARQAILANKRQFKHELQFAVWQISNCIAVQANQNVFYDNPYESQINVDGAKRRR